MQNLIFKTLLFSIMVLVSNCNSDTSRDSRTIANNKHLESKKIKKADKPISKNLGTWYNSTPGIQHTITITQKGEVYTMERKFKDESAARKEVKFSNVNGKSKFVHNSSGDFMLINRKGNLESHDRQGLISISEKLPY